MVSLDPTRPLIICDADEVLLQFLAGLERFMERQSFYLDLSSFRIHGNVKHRDTHQPADDEAVTNLIAAFFENSSRTSPTTTCGRPWPRPSARSARSARRPRFRR